MLAIRRYLIRASGVKHYTVNMRLEPISLHYNACMPYASTQHRAAALDYLTEINYIINYRCQFTSTRRHSRC